MPSTSGFSLPYPALSDPPNGPGGLQALAEAVDPLLSRATICTSATRPGSPASGRLIYETDTGLVLIYSGQWRPIACSDAVSTGARYFATTAQSIGPNVTVSLPTADYTSPLVTRATNGAGHQFTLNRSGRWALSGTLRFAASTAEGYVSVTNAEGTITYAASGTSSSGASVTAGPSSVRRLPSGAVVKLLGYAPTARNSVPDATGAWVNMTMEWLGP